MRRTNAPREPTANRPKIVPGSGVVTGAAIPIWMLSKTTFIKQKILDYRTKNNGTIVSNDNIMQKIDFKDRYSLPLNFIKLLSLVFNIPETVIGLQEISQKRPNNNTMIKISLKIKKS